MATTAGGKKKLTGKQVVAKLEGAIRELNKLNRDLTLAQGKLERIRNGIKELIGRVPPGDTPTSKNP